jgi:hypothetical protein
MVSELVKQTKVRHHQDNQRNMTNKLDKSLNFTKQASQQSRNAQLLKKQKKAIEKDKLKYARSAYMNARRPHIKNDLGYKMGDKHNLRVNNNDQEFIKFNEGLEKTTRGGMNVSQLKFIVETQRISRNRPDVFLF